MSKYDGVKDKKQKAKELLNSSRGQFIISRALLFTLERLKSVEIPLREVSDIEDMELLHSQLFSSVKELRSHLGKEILKGYPTKGDFNNGIRLLTLVKGGKDPEKIIAADFYQVLWQTSSGNWILETPMDPGADPQELTPAQAREWFLLTGPANAKLTKKYFPSE